MMETTRKMLYELEEQLKFIDMEMKETVQKAQASIEVCITASNKLKQFIRKYKFRNVTEEIKFFREVKPRFICKLIYFTKVHRIETKKPNGSDSVRKQYLLNELDKLKHYFDDNLDFYRYYRSGYNYLDHKYFIRGKHDIKLTLDSFFFESDPRYCTSHDFKISEILANDLLQIYLEQELKDLEKKETNSTTHDLPKTKLTWTDSKTALTELLYALHTQDTFENGKADIKQIASYFEAIFNIDMGDFYRTFLEIRMRKTGRTKFLDSLRMSLIKRMDEIEDK